MARGSVVGAKTVERIEVQFEVEALGNPRHMVLDGGSSDAFTPRGSAGFCPL